MLYRRYPAVPAGVDVPAPKRNPDGRIPLHTELLQGPKCSLQRVQELLLDPSLARISGTDGGGLLTLDVKSGWDVEVLEELQNIQSLWTEDSIGAPLHAAIKGVLTVTSALRISCIGYSEPGFD